MKCFTWNNVPQKNYFANSHDPRLHRLHTNFSIGFTTSTIEPFFRTVNFTVLAQGHGAFEPLGVWHQTNLNENALQGEVMFRAGCSVFVLDAVYFSISPGNFGGLGVGVDRHIGLAVEFLDQHCIRLQLFSEFDDRERKLIEPLRTLRMLRHSAWLAARWGDPTFPLNFPFFGSAAYWNQQTAQLREQLEQMS